MMKAAAYLLSMGRGGIVDESPLTQAIDEDRIAEAALDVLTTKPILVDNPLLKVRNAHKLYITPYIAWAIREARQLVIEKSGQYKNLCFSQD